jgi:pimeloyl-ACP methyl ester carboxylesterase
MDLTPASIAVQAGALRLRCLVWGRDDDPTAMLVHGNGGHAHWWAPLVPALVPGWRLLVPDLRGHGESDWPEVPAYRLDDFVDDLEAIRAALAPGPLALAGHSMGGRIALGYAARHPERLCGLALLDSRLGDVDPALAARWRGRVGGARTGRGYPTRAAALAAFRFVPDEPDVAADIAALLAHHAIRERAPGDWTFRFDRAVLSLDGDRAGDLSSLLARVQCPVLLAAGERSWVMDAAERARLAAAQPAIAMEVFPGGHHFLVAHPAEVGAVLRRFLDGLLRTR